MKNYKKVIEILNSSGFCLKMSISVSHHTKNLRGGNWLLVRLDKSKGSTYVTSQI